VKNKQNSHSGSPTLTDYIDRIRFLPLVQRIRWILIPLLQQLLNFHNLGHIHGNLHEDCIIHNDSKWILIEENEKTEEVYPPPEMFFGQPKNKKTDIFMFANIIYILIACVIPLKGLNKEQRLIEMAKGHRPSLGGNLQIPMKLLILLNRCWNQESRKRPDCQAILNELEQIAKTLSVEAVPIASYVPIVVDDESDEEMEG